MDPQLQKQIVDALQIGDLPEDKQRETMMRAWGVIFQEVMGRVLQILKEDEKNELEKMFDANADTDQVFTFIQAHVPSFGQIITEEAARFRDESLKVMGK